MSEQDPDMEERILRATERSAAASEKLAEAFTLIADVFHAIYVLANAEKGQP